MTRACESQRRGAEPAADPGAAQILARTFTAPPTGRGSTLGRFWLRAAEQYQGATVYAPPGLRDAVAMHLLRHVPVTASILDLGSGAPLVGRLRQAGFKRIRAVARDAALVGNPAEPTPNEPDAVMVDLRADFTAPFESRFDAVTCSELIEHLPSPREFLQCVRKLLHPGGVLLVTTPNVSNWIGRLRFLVYGELRWFDRARGQALHHISPITDAQMRLMLDATAFELLAADSAGTFTSPLAAVLTAPLSLPFVLAGGRRAWGDASLYVARSQAREP